MTANAAADSTAGTNGAANRPEHPGVDSRLVTLEAPSLDEARREAARALGVPVDELTVRVVSRQKRGLFGLGGEVVRIEATWQPPPPAVHGQITVTCQMGRVSLTVTRPEGRGKPADAATLDALVEGWPLDARDETVVAAALRAADGQPRVFGTLSPSVAPRPDSPVAVKIAADELTAWLIPWAAAPADEADIRQALADAQVTYGIDVDAIASIAGRPLTVPLPIARGRPARDGVDARPEFVVEHLAVAERGPTIREDGRVDYRDLGGTPTVQGGAVLVHKIAAVPAEPGFTVRGKTLPARPARDFDLRRFAGQNTALSEDRTALVARIGGLATRVGDRIAVMPLYAVSGDVDFKTGNVDFEGNLVIAGSIKPGFKVRATGSIQIGGTVEAAQIESGGDVTIMGGIVGQGEAVIRAAGTITARFVEAAELHAGGAVTIGSEIRQSTVISETSVVVAGPGRIVGGLVRARDLVEAKVLGSPSGSPTTVQAGWGEALEVAAGSKPRMPRVVATNEVNAGVTITVGGGTQRIMHAQAGGVWREVEGKIQYSAS